MIQISPQVESSQPSGMAPVPEKKGGLGVFAKILAGLLRKAGEKDGQSGLPAAAGRLDKKTDESVPEEIAALFPGQGGPVRGRRPAGSPGAGPAWPDQGPAARELAGAAVLEKEPAGAPGEGPGRDALRGLLAGTGGVPVNPPPSPAAGEEAGGEQEGRLSESFDFGALVGLRWDEAAGRPAETGAKYPAEEAADRRGRAGGRQRAAAVPGEDFSARPQETRQDQAGLFAGGLRPDGAGGKDRNGGPSRLTEARQRDRRRITLEVQDFRTGEDRNGGGTAAPGLRSLELRPPAGRAETEILVELRGGNPGKGLAPAAEHTWESRASRGLEDFLARELHQNLNGDIVRHASAALRNGGEGTIRLSLRPESLGNVKIRLEMADNKVTGHIVVESETAYRAFEREFFSLEQAFRDSGFDSADLDMSLAREDGGADRDGKEADQPPAMQAARIYDTVPDWLDLPGSALEAPAGIFTRNGRIAVNMLV